MTPREFRIAAAHNGWSPLPLQGKKPDCRPGWQNGHYPNDGYIADWDRDFGYAVNTGILARDTPGLDLDIKNPEAVEAMESYVKDLYDPILVRIGSWPKRLIPFRTNTAFKKIQRTLVAPNGDEEKIEFLGDGQQYAADGIHPDTHKPYVWHGGSPDTVSRDALNHILQAEAEALVDALVEISFQFGYRLKGRKKVDPIGGNGHDRAPWGDYWSNAIDDDSNLKFALALQRAGMNPGAAYNMIHDAITTHPTNDEERRGRRFRNLKGQIERAYAYIGANGSAAPGEVLESIRISDVERKSINWMWPNRFAFGKLGLITGLPDEGKGQVIWFIVAQVTTGGEFPCGEGTAPIGNVIVLEAEDDLNDTVRPRLEAAGADLTRVHFINMVKINGRGDKRMFNLASDLAMLRKKIEEIGNVSLVVIDPMSAYMGRTKQVDTFRSSDVRNVMTPFTELASELGIAVIAIMHFNKKSDVTNVLLRVSDSAAFTAAARHLYGVVDDRDNKRKLFVRGKNNAASYDQKTLAYRFGTKMVGFDAKGEEVWAPYILWDPDHVDISPSEAMAGNVGRPAEARSSAEDFLRGQLALGPKSYKAILKSAKADGISTATLFRARLKMGVTSVDGDGGDIMWKMPNQKED